jgi:Mg-chelatase subunit ChlD
MRARSSYTAILAVAFTVQTAAACPAPTLIIFDASYSMMARVTLAISRLAQARSAIDGLLERLPPDLPVGLRLYGSQTPAVRHDCVDTYLAVPVGPLAETRDSIESVLADTHARGWTPIAYSLEQSVADFAGASGEKDIILITDGGESCGGNACGAAADLSAQGIVINTVGLMARAPDRVTLQCIASVSGGRFSNATTAAQFADALRQVMVCPVAGLNLVVQAVG